MDSSGVMAPGGPGGSRGPNPPPPPRSVSSSSSLPPYAPPQSDRPMRKSSTPSARGPGPSPQPQPSHPTPQPQQSYSTRPPSTPLQLNSRADLASRLASAGQERKGTVPTPATLPPPRHRHMDQIQASLASNLDGNTLGALQQDIDPLLESMEPYLARHGGVHPPAASPALSSLERRRGESPVDRVYTTALQNTGQLTQRDLQLLGPEGIRQLVAALLGKEANALPMTAEVVDTSPPPTPVKNTTDPKAVVAALEDKAVAQAARELLEEQLEGLDIRRKALDEYYSTGQNLNNVNFNDYLNDYMLSHMDGFDPARMVQLHRAAKVDPFVSKPGLGIPASVDRTANVHPMMPRRSASHPPGAHPRSRRETDGSPLVLEDAFVTQDLDDDDDDETWEPGGPLLQQHQPPDPVLGASKSLLVGVSYTGTDLESPSCTKDVYRMRSFLSAKGFYGEQLVLNDEPANFSSPELLPTYANIQTALGWLIDGAKPGDSLFLYINARGRSRDDDTAGGTYEGPTTEIFPMDAGEAGTITDYDIASYLMDIPEGAKLTCIVDCHPFGCVADFPFKVIANKDGSFRMMQGSRANLRRYQGQGHVVQLSLRHDPQSTAEGAPAEPGCMTQAFLDATTRGNITYRELLVRMRKSLQYRYGPGTGSVTLSCNIPVSIKQNSFHLAPPQLSPDDDPRLCEARRRTRELAMELGLAEGEVNAKLERDRVEKLEKGREQSRMRRLQNAREALKDALEHETSSRERLQDAEAAARHNISKRMLQEEEARLRRVLERQPWSRIPAPDNTNEPVCLGVKWQRAEEAKDMAGSQGQVLNNSSRNFDVVRPQILPPPPAALLLPGITRPGSPQRLRPDVRVHEGRMHDDPSGVVTTPQHRYQPSPIPFPDIERHHSPEYVGEVTTALLPQGDSKAVRWKRVAGEGVEGVQWVREEVDDVLM
eukprot:Sspe_Gene.6359::Locus_2149_Transcript_1_1_Confidence_1.000_Length_2927::g.6359::m.6359